MASYYDEEDDIAFGPLTLKEISKELKTKPVQVNSRKSDIGHYSFHTPCTTFCENTENNSSISGNFEYVTPYESFTQLNRNELFLESLTKCIESDNTDVLVNQDNLRSDNTLMNILERENSKYSNVLVENIEQTLIENTINLTKYDLKTIDSPITRNSDIIEENVEDDSVIVISDESVYDSEEETQESENQQFKLEIVSFDTSEEIIEADIVTVSEDTHNSSKLQDTSVENSEHLENETYEEEKSLEIIEEPNLEKSSSLSLNDTLEEMERAFKYGLDYKMPDSPPSTNSLCTLSDQSLQKTSGIPKLKKTTKSYTKFDHIISPVACYINKVSPSHDRFKLPQIPIKKVATPSHKVLQQKNIVSPVGIYIKSRTPCLKQNIPVKTVTALKLSPTTKSTPCTKENFVLPKVIYKPGKKEVISDEKDVILPNNIKKLVHEVAIEKHESRQCNNMDKFEISQQLAEGDLTTVDSSLCSEVSDVSFIQIRQAFVK